MVESEAILIAYTTGKCQFYVKAAGEWRDTAAAQDDATTTDSDFTWDSTTPVAAVEPANGRGALPTSDVQVTAADILAYRPTIDGMAT